MRKAKRQERMQIELLHFGLLQKIDIGIKDVEIFRTKSNEGNENEDNS